MNDKQAVFQAINKQGMLPLFYYDDAAVSYRIIQTLYRAGVRAVEYTNRGSVALLNFRQLKQQAQTELPDLALGAGTIKTEAEATAFLQAGADFIVAPVVSEAVGMIVNKARLLWVPGCMTPTEISTAQQHQALLIKLFPAHLLQPGFVSAIQELFPGQPFVPTGGIELNEAELSAWFKAGVCAVGLGSKLITKKVLSEQRYDELYHDTTAALAMLQKVRHAVAS